MPGQEILYAFRKWVAGSCQSRGVPMLKVFLNPLQSVPSGMSLTVELLEKAGSTKPINDLYKQYAKIDVIRRYKKVN